MIKHFIRFSLSFCLGMATCCTAQPREIAITIDDLPFVGEAKNFHLNRMIDTIKTSEIPVTGFVIAGNIRPENWAVLEKFKEAGLGIGNHTLSHVNAHQVNTETYIQQIAAADKILSPVLTEPKYFRYPYLNMGDGKKKQSILQFLQSKQYHVAPITIDSKDFIFNQLLLSVPEKERREFMAVLKPCYLDFIWQQTLKAEENDRISRRAQKAQILLIHSNLLNAYALEDIINLYRQHGFSFISLSDALNNANPLLLSKTPSQCHDKSCELNDKGQLMNTSLEA